MSDKQLNLLFRAAATTDTPLRDTALLYLLLDTGCRATEICTLELQDITFAPDMTWLLVHGKGRKQREVSLGKKARLALSRYINRERHSDSDGWAAGLTNATPQGMYLARFDGHAWARVQGPAASGPTEIHSIVLVSPNEGWAGGDLLSASGVGAVLLHYVNGQWETTPAPSSRGIERIVILSATEGWAAVAGGAAGLLHYQNGRWTPCYPNA
jgi:integrase-like protein